MKRWKASSAAATVFTCISVVSLGFWLIDERVERRFLADQTEFAALEFGERATGYISDRLRSAESLQDVWTEGAEAPELDFVGRATSLVNTFGGVLAVNWIDPAGYIRWVAPRQPNLQAVDQNIFENPNAGPSLRSAASTGRMAITPPLELYQGGRGFAAYIPIDRGSDRRGYINVVFRSDALLTGAIGDDVFLRGFNLWLTAGGLPVFSASIDTTGEHTATSSAQVGSTTFTAIAQPNGVTLALAESRLGELLLTLGLLFATLAAAGTHAFVRSRERLAETKEHLQATLEAVPDLHLVIDSDSSIVDIRAPDGTLAATTENVVGRPVRDLFSTEIAALIEAAAAAVAHTGKQSNFEYSQQTGDALRWLDARMLPMGDSHLLMVARDVTARKNAESEQRRLQDQILRTQKLESLGVLAGGIAHDFNNILTSIMGHAELAREFAEPGAESLPHLTQIANSAERAAELCNQMLAYAGKGQFSIASVDLSQVIGEVREILGASLSKKVDIEYDLESDMPPVDADIAQLRQVAMNLVINAAESRGDQRGRVLVSTRSLYCDEDCLTGAHVYGSLEPGDFACLEVTDDGPGMDQETQSRAFEPFFTTKAAGRGLGLAAVLGIVRGHGGALSVESNSNGTTFLVFFPVRSEPITPPTSEEQATPWRGHGRILVVDDEESVLSSVAAMVESLGFAVVRASGGYEALQLVEQQGQQLDGVILDVTMPDLSGIEVLERINRSLPSLPVVLSSGFSEFDASANPADHRHRAFLHKPYRLQALATVLRGITDPANGSKPL